MSVCIRLIVKNSVSVVLIIPLPAGAPRTDKLCPSTTSFRSRHSHHGRYRPALCRRHRIRRDLPLAWPREGFVRAALRQESERSEEQTSELQSLLRLPYAVFCLKKKNKNTTRQNIN